MRHRLPSIDDLLLELIEEAIVFLRLLFVLRHLLLHLIFVAHLKNDINNRDLIRCIRPHSVVVLYKNIMKKEVYTYEK